MPTSVARPSVDCLAKLFHFGVKSKTNLLLLDAFVHFKVLSDIGFLFGPFMNQNAIAQCEGITLFHLVRSVN